jgi:AmmeMemoRadiSam system protein B
MQFLRDSLELSDNRFSLPHFTRKVLGPWRERVVRCWDFTGRIIVSAMPWPSRSTRRPAVAGLFYPADAGQCIAAADAYLRGDPRPGDPRIERSSAVGRRWRGGIVPHAGWICSGAIAGETIAAIKAAADEAGDTPPDLVVVFAAVHTPLPLEKAVMATYEQWEAPGAVSPVAQELSGKLAAHPSGLFGVDDRFHSREHAVEVELPLIQRAWPGAMVLPLEVPLMEDAVEIGVRTARAIEQAGLDAVYLASSDLTHYGPAYDFAPAGVGLEGLAWAKDNDRRLLDVVAGMSPERVVPEVRASLNACGGGSIAAMLAACKERGTVEAQVLRHANSYEVLKDVTDHEPDNAVGYAAVVVG